MIEIYGDVKWPFSFTLVDSVFPDNPWLWFTNIYIYKLKIDTNSSIMDIDRIEKLKELNDNIEYLITYNEKQFGKYNEIFLLDLKGVK